MPRLYPAAKDPLLHLLFCVFLDPRRKGDSRASRAKARISYTSMFRLFCALAAVLAAGLFHGGRAEAQIQQYLDGAYARGETARPLAASEMFDFSLVKNLK